MDSLSDIVSSGDFGRGYLCEVCKVTFCGRPAEEKGQVVSKEGFQLLGEVFAVDRVVIGQWAKKFLGFGLLLLLGRGLNGLQWAFDCDSV